MTENPTEISGRAVKLAEAYKQAEQELGKLKNLRAIKWLLLRKDCKTDKEADMMWGASMEGQKETELAYFCKGVERELSALKTHLRTLDLFGHL